MEKKISEEKLVEENRLLKEEIKKLHNRIKHLEHAHNWANAHRGSWGGIGGFGRNN
jgi:regulator of replication initiation timing|tara:strand:+ start:474 stop:641 length:168 start_codon:yes stop_codon:yes gene_type:complete